VRTRANIAFGVAESSLGCCVIFVLPPEACGLAEAARVTRWLSDESAAQCGPCVYGLDALAQLMEYLVAGRGSQRAIAQLAQLNSLVANRGACHHPDGVLRFVDSAARVFGRHALDHDRAGPCQSHTWLPTPPQEGWR